MDLDDAAQAVATPSVPGSPPVLALPHLESRGNISLSGAIPEEAIDGHQVKFKTQNLSVPSGATPRVLQRVLQTAGRTQGHLPAIGRRARGEEKKKHDFASPVDSPASEHPAKRMPEIRMMPSLDATFGR